MNIKTKESKAEYMRNYYKSHKERCRETARKASAKYRSNNLDKTRDAVRNSYYKDIDKSRKLGREHAKVYRLRHPDKSKESNKRWRDDNIETVRKWRRESYQRNKKHVLEYQKEYTAENKELISKRNHKLYELNKDKIVARVREWESNNPEKKKMYMQKQKAQRAEAGSLSIKTIQKVYESNISQYGRLTCCLCFEPIRFGDDSTVLQTG